MILEDRKIPHEEETIREKVLSLKKEKKSSLKKMTVEPLLIPIIQNILSKKQ